MSLSQKSPLLIPGLVGWYDFSRPLELTLNGGDVSAARTLDGSTRNLVMATAGKQPLYSPTGIPGKGSIQFTAANSDELTLQNALAMAQAKVGMTVMGVVRVGTLGLTQRILTILSSTGNGLLTFGINNSNKLQTQARRVAADTIATFTSLNNIVINKNMFVACTVQYSNGQIIEYLDDEYRTDTAAWVTGATSENVVASLPGSIGTNSSGGVFEGFIGELAIVDRALSRHEINEMRSGYFRPKWKAD